MKSASLICLSLLAAIATSFSQAPAGAPAKPVAASFAQAEKLYEAAVAAGKTKNWLKALSLSSEAIKLQPRYARALHQRACAELELGELGAALKDWDTVIELNPKSSIAYGSRGNAKRIVGDLAGATLDINMAMNLAPNSSLAVSYKAMLEKAQGHQEEYARLTARARELKILEEADSPEVAGLLVAGREAGEKDRKANLTKFARRAFNESKQTVLSLASGLDAETVFALGYSQGYDGDAKVKPTPKAP